MECAHVLRRDQVQRFTLCPTYHNTVDGGTGKAYLYYCNQGPCLYRHLIAFYYNRKFSMLGACKNEDLHEWTSVNQFTLKGISMIITFVSHISMNPMACE